ncbi:hydantoinase B/oxoprolinase family protein [Chloroflexota bacterium]
MPSRKSIDPLTLSLIEGSLKSQNQELGSRLFRQCFSFPTAYIRDIGTALFDKYERTISMGNWMPVHTAGSDICLKGMLDYLGRENIYEDDFIIANDPFIVRFGHAPDFSFIRPIFYEGELVFYHFIRTHEYDAGGSYQGCYFPRAYDCHGEGIMIPPVKIVERGKIDEKAFSIILRNVRGSSMVRADCMLTYASMKNAEIRVHDLLKRYGKETVLTACDEIVTRTEEMVRTIISKWPAGTYYSERAADWDGTVDKPVWVRLKLTVKPEKGQLLFDFRESADQVDLINCPQGQTQAAIVTGVAWSLPPGSPRNQGLHNCLTILTREGSVLDPTYPATSGAQAPSLGTHVTECVQMALTQIVPEETSALWARHLNPILTGRRRDIVDPRTKSPQLYWVAPFHSDGSAGAIHGYDGWDGLCWALGAGGVLRAPIEPEEWETPYRWIKHEFITDSMGDGQWRGGAGVYWEAVNTYDTKIWQPHDCVVMTGNSDGEKFEPLGMMGGTAGKKHKLGIIRKGKNVKLRCSDVQYIQPGDTLWSKSGGGGGIGDPLNRDTKKVQWDVQNEYISLKRARKVYGVAINPDTDEIDTDATDKLRKRMRATKTRNKNQV